MTGNMKEMIQEMNKVYNKWLINKTSRNSAIYQRKKRKSKSSDKSSKKTFLGTKIVQIDNLFGGSQTREAWRTITNLKKNT